MEFQRWAETCEIRTQIIQLKHHRKECVGLLKFSDTDKNAVFFALSAEDSK